MSDQARDLADLEAERQRNRAMEAKGYIVAPHGGWVHLYDWWAHKKKLRKRAENAPQWAP